ncbi:7086_t:CDS:10, partial [Scutellospora calospora]
MSLSSTHSIKNDEPSFKDMVYNYDWSSTLLGPMDSWDPVIKNVVNLCLNSGFPTCLFIDSPHWTEIYNEAWIPRLKVRHPFAFGKQLDQAWPELYDLFFARLENIKITGKGQSYIDEYELQRDGYKEAAYAKYTFSPIFKSDGTVCVIMCVLQETTQKFLSIRRLKTLSEFGCRISEIKSLESACRIVTKILSNSVDIPYALIYFVNHKSNTAEPLIARLIARTFDEDGKKEGQNFDYLPDSPEIIYLAKEANKDYDTYVEIKRADTTYSFLKCDTWPINLVIKEGKHVKVLLKDESQAFLISTKISLSEGQALSVILIYGINRFRALDEQYIEFLHSVTENVNTYLLHGVKIDEEKKRSKVLADLNYQKVVFFQGISHELKTPLTLMLSPLDDVINVYTQDASIMPYLQTIRRNAHRLLKLINSLLQFSNMEADKFEAHYREMNIVEFTQELALDFKIIAKKLGLDFNIEIPHPEEFNQIMGDKIYLDHDIYETIIFNLYFGFKGSNALKYTWNGSITIRLYFDHKDNKKMVVLEVSDTGVGIPETSLPHIFQRFYRVESQGSRSHEGTGIGLALVKELITRQGGDITVSSKVNHGTTFKCWFPIRYENLPPNQIYFNKVENPINRDQELYTNRQLYLEESSQWINNILVVDDNNDMRDHLADLLKEFIVHRARDGKDALRVLKQLNKLPDLILNVMMPNMNGYELLDVLRSNETTQLIPIILLSAKASENSKVTGLGKGADDYLVKPFSARELITRIRSNIKLSLIRREILFQRFEQEKTAQLLLLISNMNLFESDLNKKLLYVIKEIYQRLPCERIFIISKEQSKSNNNIVAFYENSEGITQMVNPFMEINNRKKTQKFSKLQEYLNNNSGIDISLDEYCDVARKNVSVLSAKIELNNGFWGCIKVHRSPNSIWLDPEIELFQQISDQISLAITYTTLLEDNAEKEIQIKAAEVAKVTINQILANTSHELRTPLNAMIGILSSFDRSTVTADQSDMIDIMACTSDIVISIVNEIVNTVKLEAQKVILINRTFDLLELFENTIEEFEKQAGDKNIELIMNCEIDTLPRYVKSDPERVKFTNHGKIILTISMQSQVNDEIIGGQIVKKENLLIELYDTGTSFSQGDMSEIKKQDDTGLGLSICKSLVELNEGEINVESKWEKGNKFWFTWNVEILSISNSQYDDLISNSIRQKRILIIHPVEDVRNAMQKYLKRIKKVDAFDTFHEGIIRVAKRYEELHNRLAYDIVFISLYKNNYEEVLKASLELRRLEINRKNLLIIFIVFPNNEGYDLAKKLIEK